MRSSLFAIALGIVGLCGCGGAQQPQPPVSRCGVDRTELDGVCVSNQVADYVSCVRAQGAELGSEQSKKLVADASFVGVGAGGAAEAKETLEKKYTAASDANALEILRACGSLRGSAPAAGAAEAKTIPPSDAAGAYYCMMVAGRSFGCHTSRQKCEAKVASSKVQGIAGECQVSAQVECYGTSTGDTCHSDHEECERSRAFMSQHVVITAPCHRKKS
jgi:hypothetical protein